MGRELGAAGPAIVGFYHFLTPAVTPENLPLGFLHPCHPLRLIMDF